MNHEGMIFGHAGRCYGVCESFILFGDPELRSSIGLSGLQGPHQIKEKLEKERSELRDLVSCGVVNLKPLADEKVYHILTENYAVLNCLDR